MSPHTPGPWTVQDGKVSAFNIIANTRKGVPKIIAQIGGYFRVDREANAYLIAAAPDLLAACYQAISVLRHLNYLDGKSVEEKQILDAIHKAEGK
jgi:hypothetical protein